MTAIETLERAISKLETLRDEATPEWHQGRDDVRFENTVELYSAREPEHNGSHDVGRFDDARDATLAVALRRGVGPLLTILREGLVWERKTEHEQRWKPTLADEAVIALARAILGEESNDA